MKKRAARGLAAWVPRVGNGRNLFGLSREGRWERIKPTRTSRCVHVCHPTIYRKLAGLASGFAWVNGVRLPCLRVGKMKIVADAMCPRDCIRDLYR